MEQIPDLGVQPLHAVSPELALVCPELRAAALAALPDRAEDAWRPQLIPVNLDVPYKVFLTPDGNCRGLYVYRKSATTFEVRELGRGHSNISFDYRIVAKRLF